MALRLLPTAAVDNDPKAIMADLARQRADLLAEKQERARRNEDLTTVLAKLTELRQRMAKIRSREDGESGGCAHDDEM